jgi:tRNA pseudouridine55 synthase
MVHGFLNLNKPPGFTSHDCVAKVRRLLKLKKVGHAGTLDPAASGVLPIAVGRATRLLQFLRSDKAYQATVRLGVHTTTNDLEGEVLHTCPSPNLQLDTVMAALPQFQGAIQQIPPSYSAIQVQGKRLYDLARKGEEIVVSARTVEIYNIEVLAWRLGTFPEIDLAIACGAGTYIRAIARDLGDSLGIGGTLANLIRTESSGFTLPTSLTLENLETQIQADTFQPIVPDQPLAHLEAITLPSDIAHRWCLGQKIPLPSQATQIQGTIVRIYDEAKQFLGIAEIRELAPEQLLIPKMVFAAIA